MLRRLLVKRMGKRMNIDDPVDRRRRDAVAATSQRPTRDDPVYEIWFELSKNPFWTIGGKVAAICVGLTAVVVLGAIVISVVS